MTIKRIKRDIKYWFQRRVRGWSDDETWNLNYEFIKWINTRFKKYKELASKIVDLEYHKYKYKRKEYMQLELIDKVIELSDEWLEMTFDSYSEEENCSNAKRLMKITDEILDIFKLVFWQMWW